MGHFAARVVGVVALCLLAYGVKADDIDDLVRAQMDKQHVPGLALAVVKDGKIIKAQAYGVADVELQAPTKVETVFQIQSMTKQFTATGIMILVEEGRLGLDDRISMHLSGTPTSWKDITVRNLLTHTSGIKDFINQPTASLRLDVTEEQVLAAAALRALNFAPGTNYEYSNTNYHLLAMIIRRITGESYGQFLKERIFEPLKMTRTAVFSETDIIPDRATGYLTGPDHVLPGHFIAPSILSYGGGGIRSTVLDLAKWDAALYTEKLLTKSSLEQMWTRVKLNDGSTRDYGFGWDVGEIAGHRIVAHGGAHVTGFRSQIFRLRDDQLTVIILANLVDTDVFRLARRIAGTYIPEVAPPVYKPIPDKEPDVAAHVRDLLDEAAAGTLRADDFAPPLWAVISLQTEHIRDAARSLGAVRAVTLVDRSTEGGKRSYRYRVECEKDTALMHFVFDEQNKVCIAAPESE